MQAIIVRRKTSLRVRTSALAAGLIGICAGAQTQAAPAYMMSVYGNRPAGDLISFGDYKAAYIRLADPAAVAIDSLSWQTNLCVAATLSREMGVATKACNDAVALAQEERQSLPAWSSRSREASAIALAMAYSNRGILRSVSGQRSRAQQDFEAAMTIAPTAEFAMQNLEAMQTERLASAD